MIMTTFNRFLGPLSICFILSTTALQAQYFEKTYDGNVGFSLTKEGNNLRVETCEDSNRVDWVVNQQGNVLRKERFANGSCRTLYTNAPKYPLADGNYLLLTDTTIRKFRPDGTEISVRRIQAGRYLNTFKVLGDGTVYVAAQNENTARTVVLVSLIKFDSAGNEVLRRLNVDSLPYSASLDMLANERYILLHQTSFIDYYTKYFKLFDGNGNLLWTRPLAFERVRSMRFNAQETKIQYTGATLVQGTLLPNSLNVINISDGKGDRRIFSDSSNLLYRAARINGNNIFYDNDDNVIIAASGSLPCFGNRGCPGSDERRYISLRKITKKGETVFFKHFYPEKNIITQAVLTLDDGSIVVTGSKDGKTWLLKLNCVGEGLPNLPVHLFSVQKSVAPSPLNGWITQLTVNGATKLSGDSFSQYQNYSAFTPALTTLQRGQNYPLSINTKIDTTQRFDSLFARIWLDINRDGRFSSTESYDLTRQDSVFSTILTIPTNAPQGMIAIRVRLRFGQPPTSPTDLELKAETEDHYLTIEGIPTPCDRDTQAPILQCPTNIIVNDSTTRVVLPKPTIQDNCADVSTIALVSIPTTNSTFPVGTTAVIYTATDRFCNETTCTFSVTVNKTTSVVETDGLFHALRLFPNPTEGSLFLEFERVVDTSVRFGFYTIHGKRIQSESRVVQKGKNTLLFNLLGLPQGVYFIQMGAGTGHGRAMRFVKM